MSAVMERAFDDLRGVGPHCTYTETDRAMFFINSQYCEEICLELNIDYQAVREKAAELYRVG